MAMKWLFAAAETAVEKCRLAGRGKNRVFDQTQGRVEGFLQLVGDDVVAHRRFVGGGKLLRSV